MSSQTFGEEADERSVTVELQLYEHSRSLPVIRGGEVVYPKLTSVDRTTVTLTGKSANEVVLHVPGLPIGTHLGQVKITASDALAYDNERFFAVSVLPPSSVLIVCDHAEEAAILESTIAASTTEVPEEDAEFQVQKLVSTTFLWRPWMSLKRSC